MSAVTSARTIFFTALMFEAGGYLHLRAHGGASSAVAQVPEAPLPKVGGPDVPGIGSKEPHSADPMVCGVLGALIVLNWIVGCCCAGGAAAAGAEGSEGGAAAGAGLFGCVELLGSLAAIGSLIYVCYSGLLQAWLGGQAVGGWCLFLAVLSTLQLVMCMCICCCAGIGASILGKETLTEHSKHIFGSHMHDFIHSNKPEATEETPLKK